MHVCKLRGLTSLSCIKFIPFCQDLKRRRSMATSPKVPSPAPLSQMPAGAKPSLTTPMKVAKKQVLAPPRDAAVTDETQLETDTVPAEPFMLTPLDNSKKNLFQVGRLIASLQHVQRALCVSPKQFPTAGLAS